MTGLAQMAKLSDENIGCIMWAVGLSVGGWFLTAPLPDQVCRNHKVPVFDWLHGVDYQPTCQALFDRFDAQLEEARRKASDLDDRVTELEGKLGS